VATAGSWRKGLFKPGAQYEVLKDWSFAGSSFKKGNLITYESCGYERYDSEMLFRFVPSETSEKGSMLVWHLRDSEPDSIVQEHFRELRP